MPRRRIGSVSASIQRSPLRARRRSPRRSTYTQVRSRTAVIRTLSPSRVASKPSIRTSSSSSSTSLSRRDPPGRTLVDSLSCGRGPWDGLGLIVSRDEAEPGRRIPGLGAGGIAGLLGSDLGAGSGGGFRSAGEGAAEADGLAAGFDPFGDVGLAGRSAARGRGASPRARDGFFNGLLEELTPELPDLPDWVRHRPQSYDGRLRLHLRESLWMRVGHALRVDPDHAVVDAALLHDEGSHHGVAFETPGARDLEAVGCDHVAADKTRDRDPRPPDVRLHVGFGPDQEVTVRLDLSAEAAEDLSVAPELKLP